MDTPGKWHFELVTNDMMVLYRIMDVVHTGRTSYQDVDILDTETFGRCLVLDGRPSPPRWTSTCTTRRWSTPLFSSTAGPRRCSSAGAERAPPSGRCWHTGSVERVTMVDLDPEVVGLCRRFLPRHHGGALGRPARRPAPRGRQGVPGLHHRYLRRHRAGLGDPLEGGTSYLLYTREFYEIAKSRLNSGGVLVTQAGPAGLLNYSECFTAVARTLSAVFPRTYPYGIYVPAFTTLWGMVMAFREGPSASHGSGPQDPDPGHIDRLIGERMATEPRYYDGLTHRSMFALPKYLRKSIAEEQRLVTDREPVFMI